MSDKIPIDILKQLIEKIDKTENSDHKVMAGRTSPTPQFSLKPEIIVKPKDKKED